MPKRMQEPSDRKSQPIVSREVWKGIDAVRRSGKTNMLDRPMIAKLARAFGYSSAGQWIEDNPREYSEGVFRGFDIKEDGEIADRRK